MALTWSIDFKGQADGVSTTITSNTLSVLTNDYIAVLEVTGDNAEQTAWTVSNTGTAIIWTKQAETNTASNAKVVLWTGTAGATPPTTVSVQTTAGIVTNGNKALAVMVHTGAHATTPLPPGNIFSGTGGTDVTQSITPTSAGSAIWMVAGDWTSSNTFAAAANCTLAATAYDDPGMTAVPIRPTTQPRTDALAFTIGETDTSGKIAWIAFEVQAAAVSSTNSGNGSATGSSSGTGIAAAVGLGTAGSPTTLYSRPYLNVSVGNWLGSSGGQLANDIDEPSASDADFIYDGNTGVDGEYRLEPIPDAGTQYGLILHYRPEARWWNSTIVTTLLYGATQISQWTDSLTANAGATTLDKTLTVAEITAIRTASSNASIWTDLRLRHSATQ